MSEKHEIEVRFFSLAQCLYESNYDRESWRLALPKQLLNENFSTFENASYRCRYAHSEVFDHVLQQKTASATKFW
jgi:predicted transcriptional regulator